MSLPSLAQESISIESKESVLGVDVYASTGDTLLVWLPPEGGFQTVHTKTAQRLAAQGTEVWLVDLFEAHFLPPVASSLAQIPASDVSDLIDAGRQTGKSVQLVSSGRGIQPLLRGTHLWQQSHPDTTSFHGAILLSPQFYTETPEPGEPAELLPVVRFTNLPLFILQPRLSPWFWKLEQTVPALQEGGSDVFVQLLPDVRDRFHYRPDATTQEQSLGETLATLLTRASNLLNHLPAKARSVSAFTHSSRQLDSGQKERRLRTYQGDPRPPSLVLPDLQGKQHTLPAYQGKIVLVNFWASWCPPCVHEMPSMQRLANKLDPDAFSILAVNMAESKTTIERFLHTKVEVNFPILLDRDGAALKRWGVFAFPTSYVIDKKGNIRYALFGSVEWDSEEMLKTFSKLLREP